MSMTFKAMFKTHPVEAVLVFIVLAAIPLALVTGHWLIALIVVALLWLGLKLHRSEHIQ